MSTTTRPQRIETSLHRASGHLGPVLATHVDPETGHIRAVDRPPYTLPTRPPDGPGDERLNLAGLTLDEYTLLIDQLLEDWDCPTFTELGLCRAHGLSLEQLDHITDDPAFVRALARIRSIRAKRRPERQAAARAQIFNRLLGLIEQPQDTAARAKEVRLACKHLQAIMDTPEEPDPEDADIQDGGSQDGGSNEDGGGYQDGGAEFHSAFGRSPNPNETAKSPPPSVPSVPSVVSPHPMLTP